MVSAFDVVLMERIYVQRKKNDCQDVELGSHDITEFLCLLFAERCWGMGRKASAIGKK